MDSHASALSGLFVPADGAAPNGYRTGAGIIVPDRAMAAAQLGLTPVPANADWFENFVKAYLTAADYLGATSSRLGVPFDPAWFAAALLGQHPREVYLQVLAALNHAVRDPQVAEIYQERFLSRINPAMAALIRQALRGEIDGQPRVFLARQPILRAMRTVLTYKPESHPRASVQYAAVAAIDPETAGVLLVHLVAADLLPVQASSTATIGGIPEHTAMEMVANNLLHETEDAGVLLARTWMLWSTYGNQIDLGKLKLRARPLTLLKEATGLDVDDIFALTVAYHGYMSTYQPDRLVPINAFEGIPIEREIIETYLALFASTPDELAAKLQDCPGAWQLLPIQERPLMRIGDMVLVLDEQYLIERATRGLYWFVHEHERDLDAQRGMTRWNNAYSAMVELRVEDQLRRMTPPLIGGGKTFFTEEDLQEAFPGTKNIDAGIDFGDRVLLAEVVSTNVALATRQDADVAAFNKDVEKFFLKKAEQLDATATNLLHDPQPHKSPLPAPARRILPVAIRGGQFPINPITRPHIEEALRAKGLLNGDGVERIALIDLDELEVCETLRETRHMTLPEVIAAWQDSDSYANSSLRSFLVGEYGGGFARPADVQAELARTLTAIAERLGATWRPAETRPS